MMENLQDWVAILAACFAGIFVLKDIVQAFLLKSACGSCGGCGVKKGPQVCSK
jgi:hypothetical protein